MKANLQAMKSTVDVLMHGLIDSKTTMPVLGCVRLNAAAEGRCYVSGIYLGLDHVNVQASRYLEAQVGEPFVALVPTRALADALKGARDPMAAVEITVDGPSVVVRANGAETRIATFAESDAYPAEITLSGRTRAVTWEGPQLSAALAWLLPAVSTDETRFHLHSVALHKEVAVSTDGHRMHLAPLEGFGDDARLLPTRAAEILLRAVKADKVAEVLVTASGITKAKDLMSSPAAGPIRFVAGDWTITTTVVPGTFPHYEQVIPHTERFHVVLDVAVARRAFAAVPKQKDCHQRGVALKVNGQIGLTADNPATGTTYATMLPVVSSTHTGKDLEIGFNALYLRDALKAEGEQVTLAFDSALDPVRVDYDDGKMAIIMPMRI